MAETLIVPFRGEGSGTAPLTWGQQTMWRAFELGGRAIWLSGMAEVPAGVTVADLADRLAYQVSRHQSLRTRLVVADDAPVQQVLSASGELELEFADAGDDDDPLQVAKAIKTDWEEGGGHYDFATTWPVRVTVVRRRGVPVYQVHALSHITVDSFGVLALRRDLAARAAAGDPPAPVTAMQPLEEARWQASPAGQRHLELTLRYWRRLLHRIPAHKFPDPAGLPQAHNCRFHFDSRAAELAIQAIAARTQFGTQSVLLAALAVGLARATGVNPMVLRIYVSNRFRPRLADAVSTITQTCPFVVDVAGATFDEAVRRTYYSAFSAYKHAYFEPAKIRELLRAVEAERGEQVDVDFVCNDIRRPSEPGVTGPPVRREEIEAALALTTLTCEERAGAEDPCTFTFSDPEEMTYQGAPPRLHALVAVDDHYVPRAQVLSCLRDLEAVLVSAAFDPHVSTGI
ncbi:MAG TPA: condensation domain-containing protein [Streptosporangiaceae bacterium]|nr:condensation domain-containing protein [Streptosporangiaceae bacterium]